MCHRLISFNNRTLWNGMSTLCPSYLDLSISIWISFSFSLCLGICFIYLYVCVYVKSLYLPPGKIQRLLLILCSKLFLAVLGVLYGMPQIKPMVARQVYKLCYLSNPNPPLNLAVNLKLF